MGKMDKELQNQMRVRQTRKKFEKFISECEVKEKQLIDKAAQAKKNGLKTEYQQTLVFLKMIIARKEKSKHMLHQLTLQELLKQEAANTKEFNDSMVILSKETSKLFGNFNYKKMIKEQQKMSVEAQKTKSQLEMYLDQADSVFDDLSTNDSNVEIDSELEERINSQLSEIDVDIDQRLQKFNEL